MGIFENVLICTDLDGTVLKNDGTVSDENRQAIEFFKSEGGAFTFVTGRMPYFAEHIYNMIRPNVPVGCINGGGLYDYEKKRYIWTAEMSEEVIKMVVFVDKNYPEVGIQANTLDAVYFCKENETMRLFRERTGVENKVASCDSIKEPIAKIVFGSESDEEILAIEKALKSHPLADKFDVIRSERTLFEILPKGTNKATSLKKLSEYLGDKIKKTVAIGDYNNDIAMLKAADVGIAVENACESAKQAADIITASNENHAISKVIHDLAEGLI